jgi:diguanylate cyclase (GGDEF)-like protein
VSLPRARSVRIVKDTGGFPLLAAQGRPKEERGGVAWIPVMLRMLAIAWAGAIVVALLDEFGGARHLPFLMAMGMTGLLVAASFVLTHDEMRTKKVKASPGDDESATDLLTKLPTFNYFSRRLTDEFNRSRRTGRSVSVVLIDVNNLTAVNQEYGVRAGDEVLRHVAASIEATKRYNDVVARLGDDEFGVLLVESGEDGVNAFVMRLEDRLARESAVADVNGRTIALWAGVCSGSSTSSPSVMRPEAVLESAMAALNQAKQERERRRRMWLSA